MNDILNIAGKAAQGNDRMLFIATLLSLGAFAIYIMRRLLAQAEIQADRALSSADKNSQFLRDINDRAVDRSEKHSAIIAENTLMASEVKQMVGSLKPILDNINRTLKSQ